MTFDERELMDLKEQLVEKLLANVPDCRAIYRFGSWGTAAERPDSDLDLAFLPVTATDSVRRWELAQQIACLVGRDVDLVDLVNASTVLRMQVISDGERWYCSDTAEVGSFEDLVFSDYARLNEERREILNDIRQRGSVYGK